MNWAQFKDHVSHMYIDGAVVSYTTGGWVAGSSPLTAMTNTFVTEFSENI